MCRDLFLFLAVAFLSAHGTFSAELPSFIVLTGSSLAFRYQHDSRRIFPANGAVLKVGSGGVDDVDEVKKVVPTRAFQPKEISEEFLEDIKEGAPSDGTVMKQLLGINAFSYILAIACIFFIGMNTILGPGWLGQSIGLEGTGTFTQVSESLPDAIDLNSPENLLKF